MTSLVMRRGITAVLAIILMILILGILSSLFVQRRPGSSGFSSFPSREREKNAKEENGEGKTVFMLEKELREMMDQVAKEQKGQQERATQLAEKVKNLKELAEGRVWQEQEELKDEVDKLLTECTAARDNSADIFSQPQVDVSKFREMNAAVFFLHVEKCGGSTIWEFIKRNEEKAINIRFKENTRGVHFGWSDKKSLIDNGHLELFQEIFENNSVVIGHFAFGIHEITFPRPYMYITLLREPFDRLVSQFHWWKKLYDDKHGRDLMDFATNTTQPTSRHRDNLMTRVLCGTEAYFTPRGELSYKHLLCAMRNLLFHFPVVMITERYEDSLELLSRQTGWDKALQLATEPKNKNGKHTNTREGLPDEVVTALDKLVHLDTLLYRFANCLLDRRLKIIF